MKRLRIPSTLPDDVEDLIYQTIGACIAVHDEVGPGLLEFVYAQALAIELESRQIRFVNEHLVPVVYKGKTLGQYRIDILVDGRLVLELKAVEHVLPVHIAQTLTYLKATKCRAGLLINFNVDFMKSGIRRVVL